MPYVALKAIEYDGRMLSPGDPIGDNHPKRSLVTNRKIKWIPADGESEVEPIARSGDRSIDYTIPAPRVSWVSAPKGTTDAEKADLQRIADRQTAIVRLVKELGATTEEVEAMIDAMPAEEVEAMINAKPKPQEPQNKGPKQVGRPRKG